MKATAFTFLLIAFFISCAFSQKRGSRVNRAEIKELVVFPSISIISTIETKSVFKYDSNLSDACSGEINKQLSDLIPTSIKRNEIQLDTATYSVFGMESMKMLDSIKNGEDVKNLYPPAKMFKILDSLKQDFGIVAVQYGFTRTEHNNANQSFKNNLIGIGSFGLVNIRAIPFSSLMQLFIVDRAKRKILYYEKMMLADKEPTDKYVIKIQLRDLVNNCLNN